MEGRDCHVNLTQMRVIRWLAIGMFVVAMIWSIRVIVKIYTRSKDINKNVKAQIKKLPVQAFLHSTYVSFVFIVCTLLKQLDEER